MNLENLYTEISTFSKARDWDQFHSIKNLSMALAVESSELLEISQWLTEEQSNKIPMNPVELEKLEDEVADIFIYLLRISKKANIDLEKSAYKKMLKNEIKYPINLAKGNSKKYNEF